MSSSPLPPRLRAILTSSAVVAAGLGVVVTAPAAQAAPPTATISMDRNELRIGETAGVTITFSDAPVGFTAADLTADNGTLSGFSATANPLVYTVTFTPATSVTDSTNVITLDNAGVTDGAGNAGSGTSVSANYAIDTTRPTATVVVADSSLRAGETSLVTVTFSEAVTGFTNADLTVANSTLSSVSSSDGGITWTATLTPTAGVSDATNQITLDYTGVADTAGNAGSGTSSSNNYAIDTARPSASVVVADSSLSAGETSLVTVTFSEAVTGFTNADLTVANGTLSAVSSFDGGVTWTATLTPTAGVSDATNLITLDNTGVADLAGNAGSGATNSNNYAIDTARPSSTVVVADSSLSAGETSLVTITFSEAVTGFSLADLAVANGTLSGLSSSDGGVTWTATLTPTASLTDATNVITLNNTGVTDTSGNAGAGVSSSNNYAVDTVRPSSTVVVADSSLIAGETSLVTVTFSEAVSGFTNADLIVGNGTLGGLSSSDGGVTWTATLTPTAGVSDATNVITLNNTGVADVAGNAGLGTTNSNNYAIDTARPSSAVVVADNTLTVGETSLVTVTFSEAVTGFTNADLTVANGTLTAVSSSDGGMTWTATLTPTASVTDATNVITLDNAGVEDSAGNAGVGTTDSGNYAVDTTVPAPSDVLAPVSAASGPDDSASRTWAVDYSASDAMSGVASVDLYVRVPGETAYALVNTDSSVLDGTFSYTGAADGSYTFYTVARDRAGNVESAPAAADVTTTLDTRAPAVRSVMAPGRLTLDLSRHEAVPLRFRVDESARSEWRFMRAGKAVRSFRTPKTQAGVLRRLWGGRTDSGVHVGPGRYRVVLIVRDAAGNRSSTSVTVRVTR